MRVTLLMLIALWLPACGFSPVYSENNTGLQASLPYIALDVSAGGIPSTATHMRVEQLFKQYFNQTVNPRGREQAARYHLNITVGMQYTPLAIQQDSRVTRMNINATGEYSLTDTQQNYTTKRRMRREGSFDATSASQYATFSAEQDAQERILRELAWDVAHEVAGLIKKQESAQPKPAKIK